MIGYINLHVNVDLDTQENNVKYKSVSSFVFHFKLYHGQCFYILLHHFICIFIFSLSDYVTLDNMWCGPQNDEEHSSLSDAKKACTQNKECKMFYDAKSRHKNYVICGSPYQIKPSTLLHSRLYIKCKSVFPLTPFRLL